MLLFVSTITVYKIPKAKAAIITSKTMPWGGTIQVDDLGNIYDNGTIHLMVGLVNEHSSAYPSQSLANQMVADAAGRGIDFLELTFPYWLTQQLMEDQAEVWFTAALTYHLPILIMPHHVGETVDVDYLLDSEYQMVNRQIPLINIIAANSSWADMVFGWSMTHDLDASYFHFTDPLTGQEATNARVSALVGDFCDAMKPKLAGNLSASAIGDVVIFNKPSTYGDWRGGYEQCESSDVPAIDYYSRPTAEGSGVWSSITIQNTGIFHNTMMPATGHSGHKAWRTDSGVQIYQKNWEITPSMFEEMKNDFGHGNIALIALWSMWHNSDSVSGQGGYAAYYADGTVKSWFAALDLQVEEETGGVLFQDDFETGSLNSWTGNLTTTGETIAVNTESPFRDNYSFKATTNGGGGTEAARTYKVISGQSEVYVRGYVNMSAEGVADNGDYVAMFLLRAGSSNDLMVFQWAQNAGVESISSYVRNGAAYYTLYNTSTTFNTNTYYCVELHWKNDAVAGGGDVKIDGVTVLTFSGLDTADYGDCTYIYTGIPSASNTAANTIYIDNFVVSTTPIGLEPDIYTLTLNTEGNGTASPTPSGYEYTDGLNVTLTAEPDLGWSFAAWEIDGVNETETESIWYVVMDADKTAIAYFEETPPTSIDFSDSFETASFSAWTSTSLSAGETLEVISDAVYNGTYGVNAETDGGGGLEYSRFTYNPAVAQSEVYVQGMVKVVQNGISGAGDNVNFIRFRKDSETLLAAGWRYNGGSAQWVLIHRDGTGWVTTYNDTDCTEDDWYIIQVRWESASSGNVSLWVNETLIISTASYDTTYFGGVNEINIGLAEVYNCGTTQAYFDDIYISSSLIDNFYSITLVHDGTGTTTPTIGTHLYLNNTQFNITASTPINWNFLNFNVEGIGNFTGNPLQLTSNSTIDGLTVTAYFEEIVILHYAPSGYNLGLYVSETVYYLVNSTALINYGSDAETLINYATENGKTLFIYNGIYSKSGAVMAITFNPGAKIYGESIDNTILICNSFTIGTSSGASYIGKFSLKPSP